MGMAMSALGRIAAATAAMATITITNEPNIRPAPRLKKQRQEHVQVQPYYSKSPGLNRSRHWPPASSYADARAMSPYPNRPVR